MKVVIPTPATDFDPTEAAVPWKQLTKLGVNIVFATPDGKPSQCDPIMIHGEPFGSFLAKFMVADNNGQLAYREMLNSPEFNSPISWHEIVSQDYDGILLPGGHAQGIKPYLESEKLQTLVAEFFAANKPVAAVCHGVVLVARSKNLSTGKSVLDGRKTTSLPAHLEKTAYKISNSFLSKTKMKNYYLTYPEITVQEEVQNAVGETGVYDPGPSRFSPKCLFRDNPDNLNMGFVVEDENYVSARWPGDAHKLSNKFYNLLVKNSV